jgi:hypothetical protein
MLYSIIEFYRITLINIYMLFIYMLYSIIVYILLCIYTNDCSHFYILIYIYIYIRYVCYYGRLNGLYIYQKYLHKDYLQKVKYVFFYNSSENFLQICIISNIFKNTQNLYIHLSDVIWIIYLLKVFLCFIVFKQRY